MHTGALAELFDTIAAVREEINPEIDILGILATFHDPRTRVSQMVLAKLQEDDRYKSLLFKTIVRANTPLPRVPWCKSRWFFYRTGSFGAIDYNSLADELLEKC